jgi:alpha-glucosidase
MQWDAGPGRGFTTGAPWLPFGDPRINVADQLRDPASLRSLYRRLLRFRRGSDALRFGSYRPVDETPESVFAYLREGETERLLVALNFGDDPVTFELPQEIEAGGLLISTRPGEADGHLRGSALALGGNEGVLIAVGSVP